MNVEFSKHPNLDSGTVGVVFGDVWVFPTEIHLPWPPPAAEPRSPPRLSHDLPGPSHRCRHCEPQSSHLAQRSQLGHSWIQLCWFLIWFMICILMRNHSTSVVTFSNKHTCLKCFSDLWSSIHLYILISYHIPKSMVAACCLQYLPSHSAPRAQQQRADFQWRHHRMPQRWTEQVGFHGLFEERYVYTIFRYFCLHTYLCMSTYIYTVICLQCL